MEQNRGDVLGTSRLGGSGAQSTGPTSAGQPTGTDEGVLDSAKDMASGLMDQVREQATSQAQDKKQTIVTGLHSVAEAIRHMSDHLSESDKGPVAQYAAELGRSLGNKTDNLTRYMEGRDVRQIADDLHDFARRRPAVFL